ncbi:hypothetical protein JCGZ_14383 [Jatropha curcas]|uniref:ATG8-interacting protein 1 n=1 Tax=Jatropha curcas TaxID=180498 RepID=A0A067JXI8_JATCU|nr:ATG8-interacting protein 1 [Jatropha curcas]KDP28612.1 hypothetical protein JCGZ_14383 [Jatropha curcas]
MADNEGGENVPRGNEWEVVSLTASTYAAAPGPNEVEMKDENKDNAYVGDEAETSRALFMSGHFVFPPSQHENLPLERDKSEILNEQVGKNAASELDVQEGDKSGGKDDEIWAPKHESEEFPGIQIFDEKGNRLPISGAEFEESMTLPELNLNEKEQSLYSAATFSSFHSETELGGSATYEDNLGIHEASEQSEQELDFSTDSSHSQTAKDDQYDGSDLPCEAWWKRRAASFYTHAKDTNAFWSIFVAAAVMGLVILGQRWQQERWRALQLKWQASINEKSGRMLGPISRLKDVIVGGHRRIRGSSSNEN